MSTRDTLPADPELLAARPPNPAAGARPGTFFVDRPDGFVWSDDDADRLANSGLDGTFVPLTQGHVERAS